MLIPVQFGTVFSLAGLELLASITRAAHRYKKNSLVIGEVWAKLGDKLKSMVHMACPDPLILFCS